MTAAGQDGSDVEKFDIVWSWRHLDAERAAALWEELLDWVDWLRRRYQFDYGALPGCWWRHGGAVEELTALMCAHKAAYHAESKPTDYRADLAAWHRSYLWPCIDRLHTITTGCTGHTCRAATDAPDTYPGLTDHVAADLAARACPARNTAVGAAVEVVMSIEDMLDAISTGDAQPVDPADPRRQLRRHGHTWTWQNPPGHYRRDHDPPS
ncbi:hypothetical protein [Skermania sp. ID1734]|uniref:hypothetical protein n=1 Tax=Skermania sp. ID1734 TaxID=2597516 RepID=UPI00163DBD7B|nr:hypothetical protein [Skermania sp. ID1734]